MSIDIKISYKWTRNILEPITNENTQILMIFVLLKT